jgi:hypothetical protein
MDTQLLQPLSSHIVHIRSKEATTLTSGYNSHIRVDLQNPIQVEKEHEVHIIMSSGEFPYSFYNVSADVKNNTIIYDTSSTFTFTPKNYDIYSLRDAITDDATFPFSATFDLTTMKLTLTNTDSSPHTINWSNASTTADRLLGFGEDSDDTVAAAGTITSEYVVNLCSVHSLYIRSNIATGNVQSTNTGNSTVLQKVSVDVNGFNMIYLNQDDYRTTNSSQVPTIDLIEFRIEDQNRNLIQFNNVNFEMSFLFLIYERPFDRLHGGIKFPHKAPSKWRHFGTPLRQIGRNPQQQLRFNPTTGNPIISTPSPYSLPSQTPQGILVQEPANITLDDTHAITGKSDIEHTAEQTILNNILDLID